MAINQTENIKTRMRPSQSNFAIPILLAVFLFLPACSTLAKQAPLTKFKDSYQFDSVTLNLRGSGMKRFLQFKVLTVGLYIPGETASSDALTDVAKRIEVNYLLNIPKHELQKATSQGIAKNADKKTLAKLKARIDQLNSYYSDVKEGDMIAMTYLPGKGTEMAFNGEVQGVVPGDDFAFAFFSIWVGKHPVDTRMKAVLLGERK